MLDEVGSGAAEAQAQRARYASLEPHRSDRRQSPTLARHIDHWRPILRWSEAEVWAAMARYRVNPHPAYRAGFGRVSCAACIFGSRDQWATLERGAPAQFARVAAYEDEFGVTIRRAESVRAAAAVGTPYPASTPETMACAQAEHFAEPIILPPGAWTLPAGAMGEGSGPP